MFDALNPEAAEAALTTRAREAQPQPETPWFRGFWSAAGKAIPRAGAEMGRAMTSLMTPEAAGALDAPTMFSAPGKTPKPQLAQELREQDRAIRDAIKEMTPDASTTGVASMILHDVTRFVGKAAAYSALGGAPGAVVGMGLDEGTNEALRRMDEGVDAATAARLGVTKGIASGVAVALPVAGRTLAQTLGLAAAGGPGSFITEQHIARTILENAEYLDEADKIDPFDPLGLGVSFLGSFGFGAAALAVRRARAAGAETAAAVTPEQVDAAHVSVLQAQGEATALHAVNDLAAAEGHAQALGRASEQLATGQRVEVGDIAPVDAARMADEVLPALKRAEAAARKVSPPAPPVADAAEVAPPARVEPAEAPGQEATTPEDLMARQADEIAQIDPAMPVLMEGMERPMPVSELLAEAKAMMQQELADAPLLRVAAECALRG